MMKDAHIKQVSLPPHIHKTVKNYSQRSNIGVGELYNLWIHRFLKYRRLQSQNQQFMKYYASPRNSVPTSIWVKDKLLKEINEISHQDQTPVNRIIYT
uniref:hypothetical protein n=1 Tax=Endozoicomonas sp. ONNA1 TaxID=2828740 RepID=UPI0021482131